MRSTERGFTLYYYDAGVIDKIVYFFTEKRGVIAGIAKGAKKSKNRFGGNLEPMNEVEIILYEKKSSELPIIEKVNIISNNFSLFNNLDSFNYLLTMSDILIKLTPHNISQQNLYRLLRAIIEGLKNGMKGEKVFSYFLIWFLRIEGMLSDFEVCSVCGKHRGEFEEFYISSDGSKVFCNNCKTGNSILIPSSFFVFEKLTKTLSPQQCGNIEFKNQSEIKKFLIKLLHIYNGEEIKSLKTVQNL